MGWLSGWTNRKKITISGSTAGAQTDYQILFEVHYGYGEDSGNDIYCEELCRVDFGDIRFTKSDGETLIDYWIEEKENENYCKVWVEVPSIPASPDTVDIYIYFGNDSATSLSDGDDTFLFFDDFNDNSLDSSKWSTAGGGTWTEQNNRMEFSGVAGDGYGFLVSSFDTNDDQHILIQVRQYWDTGLYGEGGIAWHYQDTNNWYGSSPTTYTDPNRFRIWKYVGGSYSSLTYTEFTYSQDEWYTHKLILSGSSSYTAQFQDSVNLEITASDTSFSSGKFTLQVYVSGSETGTLKIYYDNVLIRKYVDPEPSISSIGSLEAKWGLENWDYRKKHVIEGSTAGAQTDYQMKIVVHRTTGTDSGEDVYVGDKCRTDFADIRFTKGDGETLLDFWLEEYDSNKATFWVEIPEIPTSPNTVSIYIYYGNSNATSVSDGDSTFLFFDDFPGSSLDTTNKWDVEAGTGYAVDNGVLELWYEGGTRCLIDAKASFAELYNVSLKTRFKMSSSDGYSANYLKLHKHGTGTNTECAKSWFGSSNSIYARVVNDGTRTNGDSYTDGDITEWHTSFLTWKSGEVKIYYDSELKWTFTTNVPDEAMVPAFWSASQSGYTLYIDWVFLRKWVDPEPTHGEWFEEETSVTETYVIVSDSVSLLMKVTEMSRTLSDSLSLTDVFSKQFTEADSLSLVEQISPEAQLTASDSLTLAEVIPSRVFIHYDSLTLMSKVSELERTLFDSLTLTELAAAGVFREVTDSLSLTDAVSLQTSLLTCESLSIVEAITSPQLRAVSDSLSIVEQILQEAHISATESLMLSELIETQAQIAVSELLSIAEQLSELDRTWFDSLSLSELIDVSKTVIYLTITDSLTLSELIDISIFMHKTVSEALALSVSVSRKKSFGRVWWEVKV